MCYIPEPYTCSKNKIKFELDLSNFATKSDIKNAAVVDTPNFAKVDDLASLKSTVDKLDFDEFKNVPKVLSNLKTKVDKLEFDKLATIHVDLKN